MLSGNLSRKMKGFSFVSRTPKCSKVGIYVDLDFPPTDVANVWDPPNVINVGKYMSSGM